MVIGLTGVEFSDLFNHEDDYRPNWRQSSVTINHTYNKILERKGEKLSGERKTRVSVARYVRKTYASGTLP